MDQGKPDLDENLFLSALRGPIARPGTGGIGVTFSPGYRSANYGSQNFDFTNKQAQVIEALHTSRTGRLHQDEIKGFADTNQRVVQIFAKHPAYGTLIRNDRQGHYWLDL